MRKTRPGLRRWALAGLAGLLGGSAAALGSGGSAGADAPRSQAAPAAAVRGTPPDPRGVVAKASAQGVRAVYTIPDYVVVSQIFDGGGPVTQAEADSTGRAASFAALPYPGENAIAAPGVLSVAFGRSVPLAYPFYVSADHPTVPAAELSDPTGSYGLAAAAKDGTATATGSLQAPNAVSGARSASSALLDDGGVVRTVAESVTTGISVGDGAPGDGGCPPDKCGESRYGLRIASVTTRSETVLGPDDPEPVTTTSLVIEGASVAGHAVTIDAEGVHAEGQALAAPVGRGVGSDNQFLGQLGLSARVVPTGVPGGADALVITSSQTFPAPGNPKGTLVMTFGGAASEITVGSPDGPALDTPVTDGGTAQPAPAEAAPGTGSDGMAGSATPSAAVAAGAAQGGSGTVDTAPAGAGTETGSASSGLTPVAGSPDDGGPAALASGAVPVRGASRLIVQPDLGTTGALYSLLGLGGVAMVGVTRLIRWRGVRR